MPLSRSYARQKSRSPAPNTFAQNIPPRKPAFLPPSHYAAAAGISYQDSEPQENTESRQALEYMSPHMSPYPNQPHLSGPSASDTIPAPSTHLNRVSRFISRSPSRSSSISLRRSSSKGSKHEQEKERERDVGMDQLGDIPLMEMQLLPTLRDTIDRMTHPPRTPSEHEASNGGVADASLASPYSSLPKRSSGRRSSAAAPSSSNRSVKPQPTVILTPAMPSPPQSGASPSIQHTSIPRTINTPKSALKSALRVQSPATPSMTEDAASRVSPRKSLRSLKPMGGRSPLTPNTIHAETPSHDSRMPKSKPDSNRSRSRTGETSTTSDKYKSALPLPKSKARSNPNTPQSFPKFAAFTTPQLQHTTPKQSSAIPRSSIPRSGNDSGSELERNVSRALTPGRLVVTNAAIVPSSSESSTGEHVLGARRGSWHPRHPPAPTQLQRRDHASGIPTSGRWREPPRKEEPQREQQERQPVGLGLRLAIGLGLEDSRGRYAAETDEEGSVYEEETPIKDVRLDVPQYAEMGRDPYDEEPQEYSPERSRGRQYLSEERWDDRAGDDVHDKRQEALKGIVSGLTRDFRVRPVTGRASVLSQSGSDEYYSQGLAITVSGDFQGGDARSGSTGAMQLQLPVVQEQRTLEDAVMRDDDSIYSDDDFEYEDVRKVHVQWAQSPEEKTPRDRRQSTWVSSKVPSSRAATEDHFQTRHLYVPAEGTQSRNSRHTSPAPPSPLPPREYHLSSRSAQTNQQSSSLLRTHSPFEDEERFLTLEQVQPNHSTNPNAVQSRHKRSPYRDTETILPAVPVMARNDTDAREREAFGIPASLSYGARISPPNSESDFEDHAVGGVMIRRSDSESSDGALSLADSELGSEQGDRWGDDGLSKGAAALFENLTDRGAQPRSRSVETRSRQGESSPHAYEPSVHAQTPRDHHEASRYVLEEAPSQDSVTVSACSSAPSIYEERPTVMERAENSTLDFPDSSWRAMLQPGAYDVLLSHYGPGEMQRQDLIHELSSSEQAFVKRLRAIVRMFFLPLRARDSRAWLAGVPTEVARLFDWFEDILNVHVGTARALKSVMGIWHDGAVVERVADVLRPFMPKLEVYQPYLARVDEVREMVVQCVADSRDEFGEYVRMREREEECEGRPLENLLEEPVQRLLSYPDFFQRLLDLTPRHHPDHVATVSLLCSTRTTIHVLDEVRAREEEYDFVKRIADRVKGLTPSLARRERRLLHHGLLRWMLSEDGLEDPKGSPPRIDELPLERARETAPPHKNPPQRASRLVSAIQAWHIRRKQSGSLSSFASSAPSTRSYDTMSSSNGSVLLTPNSDQHGRSSSDERQKDEQVTTAPLHVFVFTDLVVLATPISADLQHDPAEHEQTLCLLDDGGLSRVLAVTEGRGRTGPARLVTLDLLPATVDQLETGVFSESSLVRSITLVLAADSGEYDIHWLPALRKCHQHMLRSLSFPSSTGDRPAHGTHFDLELDTRQSVFSILASGLPMPKSPSMHRIELAQQHASDSTQQEREERGWWSLRFQQVLREVQRQDLPMLVPSMHAQCM